MTAPASRRYIVTVGTYVVEHGSGRRLRRATFGCTVCRNLKARRPACPCSLSAQRFASILGVGATVTRNGSLVYQQKVEAA